jgi:hypothetical protein
MRKILATALLTVLAASGCASASRTNSADSQFTASATAASPSPSAPPPTSAQPPSPSATSSVTATALATPPSRWGSLPNRNITPGAAGLSLTAICPSISAALEERRPSTTVKDEVYSDYGIAAGQRHRYRIDHLVPLELDGSNSIRNLWPQLIGASEAKDRLEETLHSMVCAGRITLAGAQQAIMTDWVRAYQRYVSPPMAPSTAPAPARSSAAPPPASCYPKTASGHCYEPGEFCRTTDHGSRGTAGDGKPIICEDNNGWRWEPA